MTQVRLNDEVQFTFTAPASRRKLMEERMQSLGIEFDYFDKVTTDQSIDRTFSIYFKEYNEVSIGLMADLFCPR